MSALNILGKLLVGFYSMTCFNLELINLIFKGRNFTIKNNFNESSLLLKEKNKNNFIQEKSSINIGSYKSNLYHENRFKQKEGLFEKKG